MKLGIVALGLGAAALGTACCGVGEGGVPVRFVGQSNIVIWDAKRGIEHFIRDATFDTKGKSLGFIAPTPTQPELGEANAAAFDLLEELRPKFFFSSVKSEEATASKDVEVVHEQDVSGFHAAILKASDSEALVRWLKKNHYASPSFLPGWAAPYVRRGWYFTAFKVLSQPDETKPVRMSFKTDRPFNPYSVPKENGDGTATLRMFYISSGNEVPKIGGKTAWRTADWSNDLPAAKATELAKELKLPTDAIPVNATVSAYRDQEFGTPGLDDLYFVPDERTANTVFALGIAAVLAFVGLRLRRRKKLAAV